jgi:4,5-DOPA dioxygenase extradiol
MRLNRLNELLLNFPETEKMPVLFLGHGSPMNAVEENQFVQGFRATGSALQRPAAILCISAHWETRGTWVTAMEKPRTIHDFGGFPPVLYEQQYPAPGSPELAELISETVQTTEVQHDHSWGLDHGAWSVIKHMYPEADMPVIQMSLDVTKSPQEHYELAKELQALRQRGVLIVGSGNMVHNLRRVDWNRLNDTYAYDWAQEASEKMKGFIATRDHNSLIHFQKQGNAFDLAIPTPEHYLPLLYALGLQGEDEDTALFNDQYLAGSLTMTSVKIA